MESTPKLSRDEFIKRMREKVEATLGQVADAINQAPPGYIITGSEEQVRDLFADLRYQAFEAGLQMRVDAAEAAFSPSEGPSHGQDQAEQGAARLHRADDQWSGAALAAALAFAGRGDDHAARHLDRHDREDDQPGSTRDGLPAQRRRQELRAHVGQVV